ncbi:hypothetical protein SDC9_134297 [bioreactor metagenome]|uniref:Uncharacterized protein n=1 Tax=bioreactor metagenome TaxID=1076179 RepID=A0A645DEC8_9ZZZZ
MRTVRVEYSAGIAYGVGFDVVDKRVGQFFFDFGLVYRIVLFGGLMKLDVFDQGLLFGQALGEIVVGLDAGAEKSAFVFAFGRKGKFAAELTDFIGEHICAGRFRFYRCIVLACCELGNIDDRV